ncbi:MAG TPA: hypothetical protein VEW48_28410 [Thermoanaerobaculia bacterium]|nr:hypothetical protein [Thermoanaerobaculia bacterium]
MELVRDVLDKQLVDREGTKMGRADGIVLEIRADGPPRVDSLTLGFAVLASRLHPRFGDWFARVRARWSVRKSGRYRIPWSAVEEVHQHHIQLAVRAIETPAFDWERWLRRHVIEHIPGSE